jgi:hypothetical protein
VHPPSSTSERDAAPVRRENSRREAGRAGKNIFDFLHIFLASEKNKRILHFADSLQVTG